MKKLLLIDAYAMIFRAYYAFIRAPRMNSKGENTSAIFGFCITLDDLIKKINPTHLGVAFDPAGGTFRHEAYEQYKAQRPETPEDIRKAVPVIKQLLEAMNIPILEVPGFEADDVIGTLSRKGEEAGYEVYMATPDKDYGQLVSGHVFMYRPRHTGGFELMGPKEVCDKYGLQYKEQVIDLLGLMGDASDNIPGCKGVGEKTAVALLRQFGSIENMLAHTDEIKGALRTKVESQVEEIKFSKFLATIRTDVPIALDEALLHTEYPDGDMIVNVENIVNPSLLLENKRFEELINSMSEKYRYVFVDAPPLGLVSDAERIGNICDGAILCVRGGATTKAAVRESIHQLERAGCPLLGIVLNRVSDSKGGYYHKYYGKEYGGKYYSGN